jgi:nitrogen fixation protein NifU and related proteins
VSTLGSGLQSLYQQVIIDHSREMHGSGLREPFDAESRQLNPLCGDEVTLRVRLDGSRVADVSWAGEGCSISRASTSVLTDLVTGREVADVREVSAAFTELMRSRGQGEPDEDVLGDAVAFSGVSRYPARIKCALLGWAALTDALARAGSPDPGTAPPAPADPRPTGSSQEDR